MEPFGTIQQGRCAAYNGPACRKPPIRAVPESRHTGGPAIGVPGGGSADRPLRAWLLLGDGDSNGSGRVACDPQDRKWLISEFRAAGYDAHPRADPGHFGVHGIRPTWRFLGLTLPFFFFFFFFFLAKARPRRLSARFRQPAARAGSVGLIDSDGYVDRPRQIPVQFESTSRESGSRWLPRTCALGLGLRSPVSRRTGRIAGWPRQRRTVGRSRPPACRCPPAPQGDDGPG